MSQSPSDEAAQREAKNQMSIECRWKSNSVSSELKAEIRLQCLCPPSSSNQSSVNYKGSGDKLFWNPAMDQMANLDSSQLQN